MLTITPGDALAAKADVDASDAFAPMTAAYFAAITDRERARAAATAAGVQVTPYTPPAPLTEEQRATLARELEARVLTGLRPGQSLTEDARRLARP